MSQLAASDIHVTLGGKAVLQGISATFAAGEVTSIVGPNGAGKSTLLACLAGLRKPDRGRATLGDDDVAYLSGRVRAQRIGFLPQTPEVAWAVETRTLVGLGRIPFSGARGLSQEDRAAVDKAIALTGIEDLADRIVTTLSGGERARVLLARALAGEPEWLLADEPLAGLDPSYQLDVSTLLRRLAVEQGRGVIITLHDLHIALRMSHRVLIIAEGRVLANDTPARALSPEILEQAYGVKARLWEGEAGPVIEIVGRRG